MDIKNFPENPLVPSLRYAASSGAPIVLPWRKSTITLGAGFESTEATGPNPFNKASAFTTDLSRPKPFVFLQSGNGSYVETSTNSSNSSQEHANFSVAASIGGSFLGASGRAQYESSALSNHDALASSIQSRFVSGRVSFAEAPELSKSSLRLLLESVDRLSDRDSPFRAAHGDYYVAGLNIGGSNATMVSFDTSSSSSSKDLSADVTVKVLFVKKNKHIEEHERNSSFGSSITLNAFDSLDDRSEHRSGAGQSLDELSKVADSNTAKAKQISYRTQQGLNQLGLRFGDSISQDTCKALAAEGLVTELILLPYSSLRGYAEAVLRSNAERVT